MEIINAIIKLKIPSLVAITLLLFFGCKLSLENSGDNLTKYIGIGLIVIGVIFLSIFIFNGLQSDKYEKIINNLEKINKSLTSNIGELCKTNALHQKNGRTWLQSNVGNTQYQSENQEGTTTT